MAPISFNSETFHVLLVVLLTLNEAKGDACQLFKWRLHGVVGKGLLSSNVWKPRMERNFISSPLS